MELVVVLAFGPRRTIRRSVDQARRFGAPVALVPAIAPAARPLRSLRSSRVTPVGEVGAAGLRTALADLTDDDVVLLLHDDVLLDPAAAAALADAARAAPGRLVVPATNEPGTTGYVGLVRGDRPLPLRDVPAGTATSFRTSCLAAGAAQLRPLVDQRVASAATVLTDQEGRAVLFGAAVATHLDACKRELAPAESPDAGPLLAAALIVRDEEELLGDCLASLDGLVDRVVVVDTGSQDATIDIARAHGAEVVEREWRDDFAWARNEGLALLDDAHWVLSIDADERLLVDDPTHVRARLATALADPGGLSVRHVEVDARGDRGAQDHLPRLFPGGSRFVGRIHEVAHAPDGSPLGWVPFSGITLEHLGYAADRVVARDKVERNVSLARAEHARQPGPATAFNLARSLGIGRPADAVTPEAESLYRDVVAAVRSGADGLGPRARGATYAALVHALLGRDEPRAAFDLAAEAVRVAPTDPAALHAHALAGVAAEAHAEVVEVGARPADRDGEVDDTRTLERALAVATAHLVLGEQAEATGRLREALVTPVPPGFARWSELVRLVALTQPEDAEALLLAPAAAAASRDPVLALLEVFHPGDAAELVVEVALRAQAQGAAAQPKAMAALANAVVHRRADLVRRLLAVPGLVPASWVTRMRQQASDGDAEVLAALAGAPAG